MSSRKVMDVINGIKDITPAARTARPNPRDRPMYGRSGVTMGQHLDEFAEYKDDRGRSFDQLVYHTLHGCDPPPPRPQRGNARPRPQREARLAARANATVACSSQEKIDIDNYMNKLTHNHVVEARRRLVNNVEPKREKGITEKSGKKTGQKESTIKTKVLNYGERKRPGASRYF